jgi:hypothetical protein
MKNKRKTERKRARRERARESERIERESGSKKKIRCSTSIRDTVIPNGSNSTATHEREGEHTAVRDLLSLFLGFPYVHSLGGYFSSSFSPRKPCAYVRSAPFVAS